MTPTKRSLASFAALAAVISLLHGVPAYAAESNGFSEGDVTIYTRSGNIIHKMVSDNAMLNEITRDAMVIPDAPIIVMHSGKMFLVKDHKMAGGKMLSDMLIDR